MFYHLREGLFTDAMASVIAELLLCFFEKQVLDSPAC